MIRSMDRTNAQATTDGLTGMLNRRAFETQARALIAQGQPFAVAMADLDHFKDLNDTFGHAAGDRALRVFAKVVHTTVRPGDLPARFGGEEFIFLFPGATAAGGVGVLERVRAELAAAVGADGSAPPFTCSFGVADSTLGTDLDELTAAADEALYEAKANGRDRVVIAGGLASRMRQLPEAREATAHRADVSGFLAVAARDDPRNP